MLGMVNDDGNGTSGYGTNTKSKGTVIELKAMAKIALGGIKKKSFSFDIRKYLSKLI